MTAPTERGIARWQDLSRDELGETLGEDSVSLLPLAAIEQHGAHLPLSTDLDIGEGLLAAAYRQLPKDFPLLVLPPMAVGASQEHAGFPGTLSLPPEVAIAVIEAHGDSLARAGVRRLVLFNSHGGNKAVADIAALKLRQRWGMLVVKANYFRFAPPAETLPADELRHGRAWLDTGTGGRGGLRLAGRGPAPRRRGGRCPPGRRRARRAPGRALRRDAGDGHRTDPRHGHHRLSAALGAGAIVRVAA